MNKSPVPNITEGNLSVNVVRSEDSSTTPNDAAAAVKLEDIFAEKELCDENRITDEGVSAQSVKSEQDLGGEVQIKSDSEGRTMLSRNAKVKSIKHEPILWNHVASAREEAGLAFQELETCTYQSKDYGETGQEEMMSCDCKPEFAEDGENYACGEDSNCINRLTSIECTDDECNCGTRCANQRFQLREYAGVDVFQAGKKGFGLRALVNLHKDMFVYEYVGEVIGEKRFRQRQIDYQEQGEKHFYFMMLQKGEYIDATKKGGFGRFINHSCEPNCYVDKWVVGSKLRMGIFTKRAIVTGEELTFDYNVDRYGGEATPCYCGEPTCIGYIGGKTQTEAANRLPQNVVEALGIDDEDDWADAKPKNRRRKKGEDDEEYVNDIIPRGIQEKDVPKIMATLLQSTERWLLKKLLQRISNDGDEKIQTKIVALHGYQTLGSKLEKWKQDSEISILILQILQKWPSMTKNKISSSKIETHVRALADAENTTTEVKELSTTILGIWSNLEMAYRIPRRVRPLKIQANEEIDDTTKTTDESKDSKERSEPITSQGNYTRHGPRNPTYRQDQPWRRQEHSYKSRDLPRQYGASSTSHNRLTTSTNIVAPLASTPSKIDPINQDLQAIIDAATKKQQEQAAALKVREEQRAEEEAERLEAEAKKRADRARKYEEHKLEKEKRALAKRQSNGHSTVSTNPGVATPTKDITNRADDEKALTSIFAKYVTNVSARYQDKLGKEQFKRRAKEIVHILVAKEMKKDIRETSGLTEQKKKKIKIYSRDFMERVLMRQGAEPNKTADSQSGLRGDMSMPADDESDDPSSISGTRTNLRKESQDHITDHSWPERDEMDSQVASPSASMTEQPKTYTNGKHSIDAEVKNESLSKVRRLI